MEEEQTELNKALDKVISTEEPKKKEVLEPKKVKIVKVSFRDTRKGRIVSCEVEYPGRQDNIHISSISYLRDKQVVNSGLWYNLDSKQENIQKGGSLATFMTKLGAKTLRELEGKEPETELDENGWLCFKAY
jgi:hypothetical protein